MTKEEHPDDDESKIKKDIFDLIGSYGKWQKKVFAYFFLVNIIGIWQNFAITFMAPNMDFRCIAPNLTQEWRNQSDITILNSTSECQVEYTTSDDHHTVVNSVPCTAWEYDTSVYSHTIVSEWDLVCDQEWMVSFSKSIYMVGFMVSVFVFGQISDCFGRFPTTIICYCITATSSILSTFSPSYILFVILRFFSAFGRTGLTTTGFVLLMEITGPDRRTEVGVAIQFGWCFGVVSLPLIAWLIRPWYWFQLAISLPTLPLACIFWLIPESPRWLLTQNRRDKFIQVMSSAAKQNGKELKESDINHLLTSRCSQGDGSDSTKTFLDLFRTPVMARRTAYVAILWAVNAFVYYALSYNTNELGGDPYLNFFVSSLVEFPSYVAVFVGARYCGRKYSLIGGMMLGGAACAAIMGIPQSMNALTLTFAMIGKLFITATFGLLYLYTAELFPTVVRNVAIGSCSTCARIGSIIAPFVRELDRATHYTVPFAINAALTILTALLGFLLPETKGRKIADTLEEEEGIDKTDKVDENGDSRLVNSRPVNSRPTERSLLNGQPNGVD